MSAVAAEEAQEPEKESIPDQDVPRCYVCLSKNPRYKCPGCQNRTCSLQCVQQHKEELNCSGKRDPTEFVFKKTMNNRLLLRDYRFLEDASRRTFTWERILRDYGPEGMKSPGYEGREALTRYAISKGFVIWQQPAGFSRASINRTVYSEYGERKGPGKAKKCFKFHVRWTFHLSDRKISRDETDIYEIWNLGRIVQGVIDKIDSEAASEFSGSDIKVEVKEEPFEEEPETIESDETASSIECHRLPGKKSAEMERPLEMAEKKYNYEVFMRRIVGQELYYHLDKEKTLLENLKGKILLEFPEFIVTTTEKAQYFKDRGTAHHDYVKGQPPPQPLHQASKRKEAKRPRKEKEQPPNQEKSEAKYGAPTGNAQTSHPVLDQLVNRDNPNPYDMPRSAPFILSAPQSSKPAHQSSSRVQIKEQPVQVNSLHPGFQSLLGTSPKKQEKPAHTKSARKASKPANHTRHHPYAKSFNKTEQREISSSYGEQWNEPLTHWNFSEDTKNEDEKQKDVEYVGFDTRKAAEEIETPDPGSESPRLMIDESEIKDEVEVKEEPEELPEPAEPDPTPKEQPKALTKEQIELQEALLLMEQEDYSEGSDVEDYY
ncbi:Oidioi.mRNA.OKI2018_I69.chr1.g942.t1.cds [Oikopleura dioica]|uniref:Oidioi.mRNA.OKI2018_I69.chr1.g942.t1.cds n=1 Tax=Oikopleura dioica TaxID=34765 RepID=A0ABN7SQ80_OIKDI|nr:Oidioi.mRNA.OKI2018_I69.chr1.g942.t1.cds [Oikopleura dioica]